MAKNDGPSRGQSHSHDVQANATEGREGREGPRRHNGDPREKRRNQTKGVFTDI